MRRSVQDMQGFLDTVSRRTRHDDSDSKSPRHTGLGRLQGQNLHLGLQLCDSPLTVVGGLASGDGAVAAAVGTENRRSWVRGFLRCGHNRHDDVGFAVGLSALLHGQLWGGGIVNTCGSPGGDARAEMMDVRMKGSESGLY